MQRYECLCDKVTVGEGAFMKGQGCSTPPVKHSQLEVHSLQAHTPLNSTETSLHSFTCSKAYLYALRPRVIQTTPGVQWQGSPCAVRLCSATSNSVAKHPVADDATDPVDGQSMVMA